MNCYLLPIRAERDAATPEFTAYLRGLAGVCEVLIVDGSPAPVFAAHHAAWQGFARHLPPDPRWACPNGKVQNVRTGMCATDAERVVIADDDVRYDLDVLAGVFAALDRADLVVPQNYFDPVPWHAAWDTARSLLNRALGMDYPGTLAVRRAAFLRHGCYRGDVLFENLELIRTVAARGGTVHSGHNRYVRRLPPAASRFWRQRVRQAYDSQAQPGRLVAELSLLPLVALAVHSGWWWPLGAGAAGAVALAEAGRRRSGGREVFPASAAWYAPLWLAERAVCAWLAVGCRARGGVRYAGHRIRDAASRPAVLRRPVTGVPGPGAVGGSAEARPHVAAVAERLQR